MSAAPRYPPPPWDLRGRGWVGLFHAARSPEPPPGWTALGSSLVLILNRYRAPLAYDELAIGLPVRSGARAALWVPKLWVDSEASRAGGRAIWALPKELGQFTWSEGAVELSAEGRHVATLRVSDGSGLLPLPLLLPALSLDGTLLAVARGFARASPCQLEVVRWSLDGVRPGASARMGLRLSEFRMRFPAPRALHAGASGQRIRAES